ncbi:MAG: PD-(D/E)XK nuclease family transposase, partial [Bacteroidales bacterium]|nr:PD-(D/E)XK nuclease family transposase [Bacteroidales bacterium]
MTTTGAKYINPFTDYGFKRLFGEEPNKDLLLDFLNQVLRDVEGEIVEISYLPAEKLPQAYDRRRAIFDLYCTNEKGEKFIVELQKAKQKFFKDRTVYYSTFPIQEQAIKGPEWNFELRNVYLIAILDFVFDQDQVQVDKFRHDVKLTDIETHRVFYHKLTFVYFEMPKFNKKEDELKTKYDKWLFVLKNLNKLDRIPVNLKEGIFMKLFETAEIAKLDPEEFTAYQASLNAYRDMKNTIDTAWEEGKTEG